MEKEIYIDKVEVCESFGKVRYYLNSEDNHSVQFYKKCKNKKFVETSNLYSYEFYRFIWAEILCLKSYGIKGSPDWYKCVDFFNKKNEDEIQRARVMYSIWSIGNEQNKICPE